MSDEFSIKHHAKTFKNETVIINNEGFINCIFKNCRLHLINNPRDTVFFSGCDFKECELIGDGWNYGFVEAWHKHITTGAPLEWVGPIGNGKVTKH